jgi:hypothetical protein
MGKVQIALRHWLGLPDPEEIRRVLEVLKNLDRMTADAISQGAELRAREFRVAYQFDLLESRQTQGANQLAHLRAREDRMSARFQELEHVEQEMLRLVSGMSATIYDLVQALRTPGLDEEKKGPEFT